MIAIEHDFSGHKLVAFYIEGDSIKIDDSDFLFLKNPKTLVIFSMAAGTIDGIIEELTNSETLCYVPYELEDAAGTDIAITVLKTHRR